MKNTKPTKACKNNLRGYPSEKTRWAYWMQAIEPKSEAINKAFPDYQPQWLQRSQTGNIAPESFAFMRTLLGMTVDQCAAYLRVDKKSVRRWESGLTPAPFAAWELLRVIYDSVQFKLSHPDWDGWFVSDKGRLVSPDVGCSFMPGELNAYSFQRSDLPIAHNEIKRLQSELDAVIVENTKLRQLFLTQGVVDELAAMKDRLDKLMSSIGTAHIVPFPSVSGEAKKEKAA